MTNLRNFILSNTYINSIQLIKNLNLLQIKKKILK